MRSLPVAPLLTGLLAASSLLPAAASAQGFGARVTPEGMDALTAVAMTQLPEDILIPGMSPDIAGCVSADFPDTNVNLTMNDLRLRTDEGRVIISVNLDMGVATPVTLHDVYACLGTAECDASVDMRNLSAEVELAAGTSAAGGIEFYGAGVEMDLTAEDLDIDSEGCLVGDVATALFNAMESWALSLLMPRMEDMMSAALSDALTDVFDDTLGLTVEQGGFRIEGYLDVLDMSPSFGVTVGGDANITWLGDIQYDAPPPPTEEPVGEAIPTAMTGQVQVAVADRLVNDALYEAWRGGLINQLLAGQAQSLSLTGVGTVQMIGLSEDTELDIAVDIERPLHATFGRVAPGVAEIAIEGLRVQVNVRRPGLDDAMIDVVVDGRVAAALAVDAGLGAVVLDVQDLEIGRVHIQGEDTEIEVDGARLRSLVEGTVMPMLADGLGRLPVAPALHTAAGVFINLRALESEGGWQRVGVDLHIADTTDATDPDTRLPDAPELISAGTASFEVTGSDDTTPTNLLRYRAWIDGVPVGDGEPAGMRAVRFDAADGEHVLEVAAVDLNGNMDQVPATHVFAVDGLPPELLVTEGPDGIVADEVIVARWDASDPGGRPVESSWQLRIVNDDGSETLVQEAPFAPDQGELRLATDSLDVTAVYELEVVVRDQAGNVTSDAMGFALHPSLADGGCSTAGGSPVPTFALFFMLGALLCARRRR